ncbi:unnamed protein product, partial [Mycena citricolor]
AKSQPEHPSHCSLAQIPCDYFGKDIAIRHLQIQHHTNRVLRSTTSSSRVSNERLIGVGNHLSALDFDRARFHLER